MTPDEAQRAIHDAEDLRANLPADCWRALETVAGMREEWGVKWVNPGDDIDLYTWGFATRAAAEAWERCSRELGGEHGRVVRRYVTEPEEA